MGLPAKKLKKVKIDVKDGSLKYVIRLCVQHHLPLHRIYDHVMEFYRHNSDRSLTKKLEKEQDFAGYCEERGKKILADVLKEPFIIEPHDSLTVREYGRMYGF